MSTHSEKVNKKVPLNVTRASRCVLHIGLEKTGTSTIQHFLSNNRDKLARDGVVYTRFTGLHGGSQWGFIAAVVKRPWDSDIGPELSIFSKADAISYRGQLMEAIDQEIRQCNDFRTLLISSEHFHSRLDSVDKIRALLELLQRWSDDFQVILYLRRQDRVALSHYSTQIKSGSQNPSVFPTLEADELPYYYDYERVYDNWATVFGEAAIAVRLFDSDAFVENDLVSDFCHAAGLSSAGMARGDRINESLNQQGAHLLIEVNKQLPRLVDGRPNRSRKQLAAYISKHYKGKCCPVVREEAKTFYNLFEASNARLSRRIFPDRVKPLFDRDFDDYPIAQQSIPPRYEDAVRFAIGLWEAETRKVRVIGASNIEDSRYAVRDSISRRLSRAFQWKSLVTLVRNGANQIVSNTASENQHEVASAQQKLQRKRVSATSRSKASRPFFLHVGLTKTGTTTLQQYVFSKHSEIYYLGKDSNSRWEKGCRSPSVHKLLEPIFWNMQSDFDVATLQEEALKHIDRGGRGAMLASWEALGIQNNELFEKKLKRALMVFSDMKLIFTLRNPLTRLVSAYLQALRINFKWGHPSIAPGTLYLDFDEWLFREQKSTERNSLFNYGRNLRSAVRLLGRSNVGVFLQEDLANDPVRFCKEISSFMRIDSSQMLTLLDGQERLNTAMTKEQVEFLRQTQGSESDRRAWLGRSSKERQDYLEILGANGKAAKFKIELTDRQRRHIYEKSAPHHRWIEETFALRLDRYGYPL